MKINEGSYRHSRQPTSVRKPTRRLQQETGSAWRSTTDASSRAQRRKLEAEERRRLRKERRARR